MKLRHVAALALLAGFACSKPTGKGWYLLVPPLKGAAVNSVNITAPLSAWEVKRSFDSATSCEAKLQTDKNLARRAYVNPMVQKQPEKDWKKMPPEVWSLWVKAYATQFLAGVCVASDDPRLKAK
jgi:hypothetical protein